MKWLWNWVLIICVVLTYMAVPAPSPASPARVLAGFSPGDCSLESAQESDRLDVQAIRRILQDEETPFHRRFLADAHADLMKNTLFMSSFRDATDPAHPGLREWQHREFGRV